MVRSGVILGALVLGACGQSELLDPEDFDGTLTCGADRLQTLLGQPEAALAKIDLPPATRILRPGEAISLDFSPDRLTIEIDAIGRISSVTCR